MVVSLELPWTYADAIVSTLDFLADKERSLPRLACGLHDVPALRKRLTQIMCNWSRPKCPVLLDAF